MEFRVQGINKSISD